VACRNFHTKTPITITARIGKSAIREIILKNIPEPQPAPAPQTALSPNPSKVSPPLRDRVDEIGGDIAQQFAIYEELASLLWLHYAGWEDL
jgi:hypothetical protein